MRRIHRLPRCLLPLLLLAITGCVSYQVPDADYQPFNRALHQHVRHIGILTPGVAEDLQVRIVNPAENNLPLLGPLVAEGVAASRSSRLEALTAQQGFRQGQTMLDSLRKTLERAGYTVSHIELDRPEARFVRRYQDYPAVDALLDAYGTHAGYYAAGSSTPFRPTVFMGVRLVDARTRTVLFSDSFVYNPIGDTGDAITLQADAAYAFTFYDDLEAAPDKAVEGLKQGYQAIADKLGVLLR